MRLHDTEKVVSSEHRESKSPGRSSTVSFDSRKVGTMVLTKTKIIDGRDHLLGRLASVVSKELLAGQSIVIVRCDEICVSGSRKLTPPSV